ncbi:hypothetical protein ACQ4LE_004821 [Meloidogyne hapla]
MFINFYSLVPLFSIFQFIIIFHSTSAKNLLKEKKNLLSPKENLKTLNTVKDDQSLISVKRIPYDEVFVHSKIFQMAAAAYGSVDDFVKCLSTLSGSYDVYFNIQIPCFTNENCTGFMALSLADKALILSFGTSKYAYKKLLNDSGESIFSKRRKSPLGFGSGLVSDNLFSIFYQMQLAGITKKTYDMIKFFDGYDLWITGHSIGGAIASIAAAKIASANVIDARQVKLVTFGQPRVGNKAWAAAMENALMNVILLTIYLIIHLCIILILDWRYYTLPIIPQQIPLLFLRIIKFVLQGRINIVKIITLILILMTILIIMAQMLLNMEGMDVRNYKMEKLKIIILIYKK